MQALALHSKAPPSPPRAFVPLDDPPEDEIIRCANNAAFVPTLIELARTLEQHGVTAALRFRRDETGRILGPGPELYAVSTTADAHL